MAVAVRVEWRLIRQPASVLKSEREINMTKAIKDSVMAKRLKDFLPTGFEIVEDDGNVIVNVPKGFNAETVWKFVCAKFGGTVTTDGGQNGCIWVHGENFHEEA